FKYNFCPLLEPTKEVPIFPDSPFRAGHKIKENPFKYNFCPLLEPTKEVPIFLDSPFRAGQKIKENPSNIIFVLH
ncbi:MAG TPA: hypothetical protein VNJ50_03265, partial [Gelidibacter sp.]|uniref:hypothetical protein n=1 Tax=Gelidibacter sp. TaxID=2018083 RepID=UPI002B7B897B